MDNGSENDDTDMDIASELSAVEIVPAGNSANAKHTDSQPAWTDPGKGPGRLEEPFEAALGSKQETDADVGMVCDIGIGSHDGCVSLSLAAAPDHSPRESKPPVADDEQASGGSPRRSGPQLSDQHIFSQQTASPEQNSRGSDTDERDPQLSALEQPHQSADNHDADKLVVETPEPENDHNLGSRHSSDAESSIEPRPPLGSNDPLADIDTLQSASGSANVASDPSSQQSAHSQVLSDHPRSCSSTGSEHIAVQPEEAGGNCPSDSGVTHSVQDPTASAQVQDGQDEHSTDSRSNGGSSEPHQLPEEFDDHSGSDSIEQPNNAEPMASHEDASRADDLLSDRSSADSFQDVPPQQQLRYEESEQSDQEQSSALAQSPAVAAVRSKATQRDGHPALQAAQAELRRQLLDKRGRLQGELQQSSNALKV